MSAKAPCPNRATSFIKCVTAVFAAIAALASFAAVQPAEDRRGEASLSVAPPPTQELAPAAPESPNVAGCPITTLVSDGSTSVNERAPNLRNRFGRSVYLVLQTELTAAGITPGTQLSGIGWTFSTAPGVTGNNNPLIVYLQNTGDTTNTKSTTWATAISGMTIVHNALTNIPNVLGSWDFLFSGGAFTYTGGGLYVAFDSQYPAGTLSGATVVSCNSTGLVSGLLGNQGTTAPTTLLVSNFRPETRFAPTNATIFNDAIVDNVISYGALPRDLVGPQLIQATVTNHGANALTNLPVTLTVSGANTFTDTQQIPTLAACSGRATVTFAPYAATNLGSDTLTVNVPPDDTPAGNSKAVPVDVTAPQYSFKYPGTTTLGGVGLTGATGAFVGKFTTTFATSVTAVTLEFAAPTATAYRVTILADSGTGTPGPELYLDAADRSVLAAGPVTIPIPPVAVGPGDFYVGIQQTNTTNANLSFDNEVPIRSTKFFFSSPLPPATWVDFSPGNNFKINVGAILDPCAGGPAVCNDGNVCTTDSCDPGTGCSHVAADGTPCDDANVCTLGDTCSGGSCGGTPVLAPAETTSVSAAPDKTTYNWDPAALATRYDVVRGSTAAFPVGPGGGDEVCFDDLPGTTVVDATVPAPGAGFWYLSRGENACANGSYGNEGLTGGAPGAPRVTTTCP